MAQVSRSARRRMGDYDDALRTADALPGAGRGGDQRGGARGGQGGVRGLRPRAGVRRGAVVGRRAPALRCHDLRDLQGRRPAGAGRAVRRNEGGAGRGLRARGTRPRRGHRLGREVSRRPVGRDRGAPDRDRLRQRRVDTLTHGDGSREAGPGQDEPGPAADSAGVAADSAGAAARSASVAARDSYGRLLALLAAATSDLPAAEDALADAFERALRTWPSQGVPGNPDAWLLTVARNRLRDQWKSARAQRAVPFDAGQDALAHIDDIDVDAIPDRRLELMLVCAHPAIERAVRTPLMLNTVLGFTAEQIGRAFSVLPATLTTRLVRAKKRIKAAGIPFRIPDLANLPARMASVLEAVYGAYVIDWSTGPQARRLPPEALHLAEVLATLVPGDPEVRGLAALIELSVARAPARVDASGRFVPLADQDPSLWNAQLIGRAHEHLQAAHARGQLGRFQLEAAIQAVHCARNHGARNHGARNHGARNRGAGNHGARELGGTTDWATLLTLHRVLHAVAPSLGSGVALAAVTAEVDGPAAGLATLDALLAETGQHARRFQPAKATRAHLLDRLGRTQEAVAAYEGAISLTHDTAERQYLEHRRDRAIRQDAGLGRSGQFLKQEHERLVREAGRLAQAHLAGAVGRQVRLRRRLVEPGFLVTGGRDDEFGVQQPAVTGGAAAGRADRHENLAGQPAGQPLEGIGEPRVGGGAGRVDRGALDALGDGERREQAVAPRDGVKQRDLLEPGEVLGVEV